MSTIIERLNTALSPELQVERELAAGGMGIVFLARDTALDRHVAIKIIRPEQATARATEKFLREARILANLRHPNVVPVHRAGEADGLFYYVMDYISEGTLADRLAKGPLSSEEALKLGRDLLDALEPVHDQGVVHRDIKPSNIFLIGNRAVLTDFGIARPTVDPAEITVTDASFAGTVGYMPPEQAYGQAVTGRTDLYAVAMVLFEAYTGRRWSDTPPDTKPNWSGVPKKVIPVLHRALAWEPEKRWPDARTFRRALWTTRTLRYRRYKWYATAVAAATLVLGYLIGVVLLSPKPTEHELAILPFAAEPAADSALSDAAISLRDLTGVNLRHFAHLAPPPTVDALMQPRDRATPAFGVRELRRLGVQYAARGAVKADGDSIAIAISVIDSTGEWTDAGSVKALSQPLDLAETAHQISFRIAQVVDPNQTYEGSDITGRSNAAIVAFVAGRRAFKRNDFRQAVQQLREALAEDPDFGLAAWWLANAWRWQLTGDPSPDVDLAELLETHGASLSERERQLIDAQLAQTLERRFEIYRELVQNDPRDAYVAAMYSEELYNRGAFAGIPVEFTVSQLEDAVGKDSSFGPELGSLARSHIRLGNQSAATLAVESYSARYPNQQVPEGEFDEQNPDLLRWAIAERFFPAVNKIATREHMLARPEISHAMPHASRLASMLGLPETQAEIALAVLTEGRDLSTADRADLHESRALGLVALGRMVEALQHFDSAAALRSTPSAQLEAVEWRVVTTTLGMPLDEARPPGRSAGLLEDLVGDSTIGFRATWALGLDALNQGESERAGRFRAMLHASSEDTAAERLGSLLNGLELASSGRFRDALSETRGLLVLDSAARGGDPFARAVLHMKRADWLDSLDQPAAADSMRLWYEHSEMIRRFEGPAQAAEIDWALSTYAMLLRGMAAARGANRQLACRQLPRVVELWARSDETLRPIRDSAAAVSRRTGCQ